MKLITLLPFVLAVTALKPAHKHIARDYSATLNSSLLWYSEYANYGWCYEYNDENSKIIGLPTSLWPTDKWHDVDPNTSNVAPFCGKSVTIYNPSTGKSTTAVVADASDSEYAIVTKPVFEAIGDLDAGVYDVVITFDTSASAVSSATSKGSKSGVVSTVSVVKGSGTSSKAVLITTTSAKASSTSSATTTTTTSSYSTPSSKKVTKTFGASSSAAAASSSSKAAASSYSSSKAAASSYSSSKAAASSASVLALAGEASSKASAVFFSSSTTTTTTQAPTTTTTTKAPTTTTTTTTVKTTTTTSSESSSATGKIYKGGYATFFEQNGNAGACGDYNSDSSKVIAMDSRMYDNGKYCGRKITIMRVDDPSKQVTATVADECPTCETATSLDLSHGAYFEIGTRVEGMFPILWYFAD